MSAVLRDAVWAALGTVRDPELDEPITSSRVRVVVHRLLDGVATVLLRLPDVLLLANFSWLMVADAYDAVSAVPGVTRADIELEDHFVAEVINQGVAARSGFVAAFSGRGRRASSTTCAATFNRKAALAGQDIVARPLVNAGATPEELARAAAAGRSRRHRSSTRCARGGPRWGCRTTTTRRCCCTRTASRSPPRRCRCTCGGPGSRG